MRGSGPSPRRASVSSGSTSRRALFCFGRLPWSIVAPFEADCKVIVFTISLIDSIGNGNRGRIFGGDGRYRDRARVVRRLMSSDGGRKSPPHCRLMCRSLRSILHWQAVHQSQFVGFAEGASLSSGGSLCSVIEVRLPIPPFAPSNRASLFQAMRAIHRHDRGRMHVPVRGK